MAKVKQMVQDQIESEQEALSKMLKHINRLQERHENHVRDLVADMNEADEIAEQISEIQQELSRIVG